MRWFNAITRVAMVGWLAVGLVGVVQAGDANRLVYLDESDPYYVSRTFPKLVTPQWIGEEGVEAAVVMAIDDMRDPERYEQFIRPILERLKKIDERAPFSIMTNSVDPKHPRLKQWLEEGVSLEIHTIDHPCPLLAGGDFAKARATFDKCVDLMADVEGNRPVAFRMPCCDSLNTLSPRFFAEMFNKKTVGGKFLTIDSSVFHIITANDPELSREQVFDADGRLKFRKYVPFDSFVNTIEDYHWPYVIGKLCWEFQCVTPSDWQGQSILKAKHPKIFEDLKVNLAITVQKQGLATLVFHPHGWSDTQQWVDYVDYADKTHGKSVRFLSFAEAEGRLNKNLLAGQSLRAADGGDNGVRVLDLNNDGYMDVVIGNEKVRATRVWRPREKRWVTSGFPTALVNVDAKGKRMDAGVKFGVVSSDGLPVMLVRNELEAGGWKFDGEKWVEMPELMKNFAIDNQALRTASEGKDLGVRLRDIDGDGKCELIVANEKQRAVFRWPELGNKWQAAEYALPEGDQGVEIVREDGSDAGLRFVDVDGDGFEDVLYSNETRYAVHFWESKKTGWGKAVISGKRGEGSAAEEIPMIVRGGTNNGAWIHSRHLWVQNEDTAKMRNLVDRRSFNEMAAKLPAKPKTPEAGLASIKPAEGFVVELMAAEPLTMDPVAFAWGADGKLWVAEMGDYPLGLDGKGKPGGRVRLLVDTDGDGKYDKSTVFVDGLRYANGVAPWGKGVLITSSPDITYGEDTDGDGVADVKQVLYTGLTQGNPQHRANGLVYGLDNWFYCANGDSGGTIKSIKTGKAVNISGRDFRIRPATGDIEAETGMSQFGRCRDDWGNWFGCNNINPMYQFVLPDHYLRRNPHFAPPDPRVNVSKTPGSSPVFAISRLAERFNDFHTANHFTSACSVMVYRDDLFGPAFAGNAFISEPVHNLIHREVMTPTGVTFTSERAASEKFSEFLASSDNWFRPTTIKTGPDGAIWIADMYRQVIEHPEWIPRDTQKRLDLRAGADKGRIYRVYPVGAKLRPMPRLDKLDGAGLAAAMDSPNGWVRDMAQQLIVERQEKSAVPALKKLAVESARPVARLHALSTLDGLGSLDEELLVHALGDAHAGVRRHAVRLCEGMLSKSPRLGRALAKMTGDVDPQVRMQIAFSLGEWSDEVAGVALGRLAAENAKDRFIVAAVTSSLNSKNLANATLAILERGADAPVELLRSMTRLGKAMKQPEAIVDALAASAIGFDFDRNIQMLDPLLEAWDDVPADIKDRLFEMLKPTMDEAHRRAVDDKSSVGVRVAAIRLLARLPEQREKDLATLKSLLLPQSAVEIQSAAIATLARQYEPAIGTLILSKWKNFSPAARAAALDAMLSRPAWTTGLLDAIEAKKLSVNDLDAPRRQRLAQHNNKAIRGRALALLAEVVNPDRQKVLDAYAASLTLGGDAQRGAVVFTNTCAACHKLGELGTAIGPDLGSVADKTPESLIVSILDPNRAVETRYTSYVAETRDGQVYTGVLTAETGTSVTLSAANMEPVQILRGDLKSLRSTGTSLMPEGLESGYTPHDLADLIAFVGARSPARERKKFEGNAPAVVSADADGVLKLLATNCEIYGESLILEKQYTNLGWWREEADQAVWTVEVPAAGKYEVTFHYACDDDSAGNRFVLQAGTSRLTGTVTGTGNWDTYKKARIGEIHLPAGRQRLSMRSAGNIDGAMIDLKGIELKPMK